MKALNIMINHPIHVYKSYKQLANKDYNELADKSSLKGFLRVSSDYLPLITRDAEAARLVLQELQNKINQRAYLFPLQHLPLMLCKSPARSGANFLRWRNQHNTRSGTPAFEELLSQSLQKDVKDALFDIEHDRIIFNMQMSIVTFILRQARECEDKLTMARFLR